MKSFQLNVICFQNHQSNQRSQTVPSLLIGKFGPSNLANYELETLNCTINLGREEVRGETSKVSAGETEENRTTRWALTSNLKWSSERRRHGWSSRARSEVTYGRSAKRTSKIGCAESRRRPSSICFSTANKLDPKSSYRTTPTQRNPKRCAWNWSLKRWTSTKAICDRKSKATHLTTSII